jgi:hypothetical protein
MQVGVNAACDVYELIFRHVERTVVLYFRWAPVGSGQHTLLTQGGSPNYELSGLIEFNNSNDPGQYCWYLDPNPLSSCSQASYTNETATVSGTQINAGRWYWMPGQGKMDLFTIALHEVGHALGMSIDNHCFQTQSADGFLRITGGQFSGMEVPLLHNNGVVDSHIDDIAMGTMMSGSFGNGMRALPSVLDIVALGQLLGEFDNLNWDMIPELKIGPSTTSAGKNLPGTVLDLSWIQPLGTPTGTTHYVVQSCSDLQVCNWTTIATNSPQQANGRYTATIVTEPGANAFFRLKAE